MKVSEKLLEKYNVPVPRYTSYPPANHFRDSFSEAEYQVLLKDSNKGKPENIGFYIHIPFCRKICYYCGCNACAIGRGNKVDSYLEALRKEIEMVSGYIDKSRPVSQIHYGGGTPNSIPADVLRSINDYLFSSFSFIENPEIAIELNPAYLSYSYADELLAAGFNRFSLGIQDFNRSVLKMVNRAPSAIPPQDLFNYLKKDRKNVNVNLDFIYGLPGQTPESFQETITEAIKIRPERLVTFSYAHVPWVKKHQLILEKKGLPSSDDKMQMFINASGLLTSSGYKAVGLDHFVLPSDELYLALNEHKLHRNFQGYCTRRTTGQVYAFGVTAISQLEKGYSQNTKDIDRYIESINSGRLPVEKGYNLNRDQICTREVITGIMCNQKISFSDLASMLDMTGAELKRMVNYNEKILGEFEKDGLIRYDSDVVEVTATGSLFVRNVAAMFDKEYISKTQNTYSKPV